MKKTESTTNQSAGKKRLKVLFVSAEAAPFSKLGGLSQVAYFLPRALRDKDVDIRVFTPNYGVIDKDKYKLKKAVNNLKVPTDTEKPDEEPEFLTCNVKSYKGPVNMGQPTVYFLENEEYYEKRANVYGYNDDHIRFGLLSRAALEFIKTGEFVPDIVHCNDWHTGYLTDYLAREREQNKDLEHVASVLSIHNTYQGQAKTTSELEMDDGKAPLASFFSEQFEQQNGLKRGIIYADRINTVSERYSKELLMEEYGNGLHRLLRELRGKLSGILNGLDYREFNPSTDKIIKQNYSFNTLSKRKINKLDLQREFGLEEDPDVPILAMTGRLSEQKGIDLVMQSIKFILDELKVQFVILGPGDQEYVDFFEKLEKDYPGQVGTHLMSNFILPRKIFAGADIVMMPSQYEPGGIVAIEAMRYGAVPLVRDTGGLADIVSDYNPTTGRGTGFKFTDISSKSFLVAVVRAVEAYRRKDSWERLVARVMRQDFSWNNVATEYCDLYERTINLRQEALQENPAMMHPQSDFL